MLILEDNSNLDIKLNEQEDLPKKISAIDQIIEQLKPKEVPIKNFKVAFIHDEFTTQHGIMILSAVLKQHGFQTDVFITEFIKESIADEIVQFKPDVIACSTMTPGFRSVMNLVGKLKERLPGVFVVMGGSHPTLFPDMFEKEKDFQNFLKNKTIEEKLNIEERKSLKVLELSLPISLEKIKKKYKKLVKIFHPDVNDNNKKAENHFKEINEAYRILLKQFLKKNI